jgi:pimeloyl-ACP methyl ester carboxylesterase
MKLVGCLALLAAVAAPNGAEDSKHEADWMGRQMIQNGEAELEVLLEGNGPSLVLLPSLGRGAHDFDDLSHRLAKAGYRVVRPQPRGIGESSGTLDGLTMQILAGDVAAVIRSFGNESVIVAGHAFGNRVARMLATLHPELVHGVVLLAAGGRVPIPDEIGQALRSSFDDSLSERERLAAIELAFFAEGHDPAVWRDGWYAAVAAAQGKASRETPVENWWAAGGKPLLVVQPAEDRIAPIGNAEHLAETYPDRVRVVEIPRAGHALLPEQPEAVAAAMLTWLQQL